LVRFADRVTHVETREGKIKTLNGDAFVLCNHFFVIKQLIDLKIECPLLRCNTSFIKNWTPELTMLNGPCTILNKGGQPSIERSLKFTNLFFWYGFTSSSL